jgi:oxygen-independent coproporphyrinogen-3 oxidase
MEQVMPRYARAVESELATLVRQEQETPIETVFAGGGTPTILPTELLIPLFDAIRKKFSLAAEAEISIEANPGTVTRESLARLRQAGINRISLGIQSFNDSELGKLGRRYRTGVARQAVMAAKAAGFDNLSIDLIYGVPGQLPATWRQTLEESLSYVPQHLSCYQLTIEDGTPFAEMMERGDLDLPGEEDIEMMDEMTVEVCRSAGLRHYEISNFAQPGRECRHNINYWRNGDYYAVGSGAVSCISGRRQRRTEDPVAYCRMVENGRSPVIEEENLDRETSFRESVVIGMRMLTGISRADLVARYGMDVQDCYGGLLDRLQDGGLVELSPTHLRLTDYGRRVANTVLAELV